MIGSSNALELRQHAYSIFTASRRHRDGGQEVPESVLRPMSPGGSAAAPAATLRTPPPGSGGAVGGPLAGVSPGRVPGVTAEGLAGLAEVKPAPAREPLRREGPAQVGPSNPPRPTAPAEPTEEAIRRRAYEIYQHRLRLGQPGDALSDWLLAEAELRQGLGRD
ncbi:MAG: hypothetical protein KatS3mg103_0834 [Phycisphaerales bacterium]|nr:MAG: hypothetical protein KatS3mg103_0834 [Phycisphaerales bacterium]